MASSLLLHELTREEARASNDALLVVPTGALEQHGPHLSIGLDSAVVEDIARRAAAEAAGRIPVLVAPTVPFGSSDHHLPFGGTMTLKTETYYRVLSELIGSLITGGFRRFFILNGHGGNHEIVQLVARDLALAHPVNAAAGSYWVIAWDALIEARAHTVERFPMHAGAFGTSIALAAHPQYVRAPLPHRDNVPKGDPRSFYRPYRAEVHGFWESIDGFGGSPDQASAEHGRQYLSAIIKAVADAFVEFYRTPLA